MRTIGSGAFGRVKCVRHAPTGQVFALKCMAKSAIVKMSQVQNVFSEKRAMRAVSHPFLLQLHETCVASAAGIAPRLDAGCL